MKQVTKTIVALGTALCLEVGLRAADHAHLNAGAFGTLQDDQLIFDNGGDFETISDYVKTLTFTNDSTYAGFFQGNITLTVLPQTPVNAGPAPNAPALGSVIEARLVSVEGPEGGAFAFWETGATNPTISLVSGETGTNSWRLTESDGSPGTDPYGHFHGRRFTATVPGIYEVEFQLFDVSTNGVGGGPIHKPSEVLFVYFQAGVIIQSVEPDEDHTHVKFAGPAGSSWQLEATDTLGPLATWTPIEHPVVGDDLSHEIEDESPVEGRRFYRVRSVP